MEKNKNLLAQKKEKINLVYKLTPWWHHVLKDSIEGSEKNLWLTRCFDQYALIVFSKIIIIIQTICGAHINPAGCSRRESWNTRASPFFFTISVLGSFTCITQHTGPIQLYVPSEGRSKLWLSVLLKDTSAANGIQTHILTTPGANFIELLSRELLTINICLADFSWLPAKFECKINVLWLVVCFKMLSENIC